MSEGKPNKEFLNALFNKLQTLKKNAKQKKKTKEDKQSLKDLTHCPLCGYKLTKSVGFKFCKNGHKDEKGNILQPISNGSGIKGRMVTVKKPLKNYLRNLAKIRSGKRKGGK